MVDFNFLTDCYDNDDILTNKEKLEEIKYMLVIIILITITVLLGLNIYTYHSQLFKFTLYQIKNMMPFLTITIFTLLIFIDTRIILMAPIFLYLYFIIL